MNGSEKWSDDRNKVACCRLTVKLATYTSGWSGRINVARNKMLGPRS